MAGESHRLFYVVHLPGSTLVEHEVLNTAWPLMGDAASECKLVMPGPPQDYESPGLALTRPMVDDEDWVLDWFEGVDSDGQASERYWGWAQSYQPQRRRVVQARVHRAIVVASIDEIPDNGEAQSRHSNELGRQIDNWVGTLHRWLEALVGLVLGGEDAQRGFPSYVYPLPVLSRANGGGGSFAALDQRTMLVGQPRGASLAHWELAVDKVNTGEYPPHEHVLLRDGRAAWHRGDARKALIDVATAVEVALSTRIRTFLGGDSIAIDHALKGLSGVVELYDLAATLGVRLTASRNRVIDQLAGPRNLAVHAGNTPADSALRRAHDLASQLVWELAPLSRCGEPPKLESTNQVQVTKRSIPDSR